MILSLCFRPKFGSAKVEIIFLPIMNRNKKIPSNALIFQNLWIFWQRRSKEG